MALNLNSLAALRIACALALLGDLVARAVNLTAHYTDAGVLPRWAHTYEATLSVHMLGGSFAFQITLFALAAALAIALLLGWRTRIVSILSWWLLLSLHQRNPLVLSMGDGLFLLVLFWGMFLPWGERWALDRRTLEAEQVTGLPCLGYLVQMAVLYPMTAYLKSGAEWKDGTAVYYALTAAQYETPPGQWLRSVILAHPGLSTLLTYGVLALEYALGVLLLVPALRGLGVALVWFLQLGLGLGLSLGFFPIFASVAVIGLIPGRGPQVPVRSGPLARLVMILALAAMPFQLRSLPVLAKLGLDQQWYMFAPHPPTVGGWYMVLGRTREGNLVDLLHPGQAVSWERPDNVPRSLGGMRWQMYYFRLLTRRNWAAQRPVYARQAGAGMELVQLIYVQARTVPFGREASPTPRVVWEGSPGEVSRQGQPSSFPPPEDLPRQLRNLKRP